MFLEATKYLKVQLSLYLLKHFILGDLAKDEIGLVLINMVSLKTQKDDE